LSEADWAQFRELVTGVGEGELAALLRDYAPLLRPFTMGEEEFAVILHGYADSLRNVWPNKEPAIPLKKPDLGPWPAPGAARGPLAWSDEEHAAFIRDHHITFPGPTAEPQPEARLEALNEAIESGAIHRKKPGRRPGESKERGALVRAVAQACLDKAGGRTGIAKRTFIERVCAEMHIGRDRADNLWYEVTEAVGRTRRVL
jgi:hypothetical protein